MNNHFHLLVRQRDAPLASFMQPVMRRTALLLKAGLQLEDHVFGRRYWNRQCRDVNDLRACIRYIHCNPVRAGCCSDPGDYPWSSHVAYARVLEADRWKPRLEVLRGIFAKRVCQSETELCAEYLQFVGSDDAFSAGEMSSVLYVGDSIGRDLFASGGRADVKNASGRKRPDLRDVVH